MSLLSTGFLYEKLCPIQEFVFEDCYHLFKLWLGCHDAPMALHGCVFMRKQVSYIGHLQVFFQVKLLICAHTLDWDDSAVCQILILAVYGIHIHVGKNIGQQYCWCSLMWLMPLRSLSNCDYELIFYLRLRLGPIHSNQVMGTDPVGSHHGTRNSQSNSINPTYPY